MATMARQKQKKKKNKYIFSFIVKQNLNEQTYQMDFNATNLQKDDSTNNNTNYNNNNDRHTTCNGSHKTNCIELTEKWQENCHNVRNNNKNNNNKNAVDSF